jgi:hypothetical protein
LGPTKQRTGRFNLSDRGQFRKSELIEFLLTRRLGPFNRNTIKSTLATNTQVTEQRCRMALNASNRNLVDRRYFIGGSDARIIMGDDEAALLRLWREKRGETEPEDLSGNLVVQLGLATEELNRRWYEANTGRPYRCPTADQASGTAVDGGHSGWPG